MVGTSNDWSTSQLAEFVAVLSATESVKEALEAAAERAAEALEAEVGAVLAPDGVLACIGFRVGAVPEVELLEAAEHSIELEVPGAGRCRTIAAPLEDPSLAALVVARSGDGGFSYQEATLLRGMGQVLLLTMRLLRTLEEERRVRAELQDRQASLERLSRIQTAISRRAPLQDVLDAITAGAKELLGVDVTVLRLLEPDGALRLGSSSGLDAAARESLEFTYVRGGVSAQAADEDRLVVVNDYASYEHAQPYFAAAHMRTVMGIPIHGNQGEVIGSLTSGSYEPSHVYSEADARLLSALAEHASLAITDARMMEEKRLTEQQFVQAQKMEAIGNLAGGIAHDFNNLLFVIQTSADFLTETIPPGDPQREDVDAIIDASKRAATLTRQLLLFSRRETIAPETLDVNEVVTSMRKLLGRTLTQNIELDTDLAAEHGWTLIDRGQLEQVLLNLAVNAQDAMPRGGRLEVATRNQTVDARTAAEQPGLRPGDYVVIEIRDTGVGMTPEVAERVFEPFFTTKPLGGGTGLGLASVYGIIKRGDGYIGVDSTEGEGSVFTIYLPTVPEWEQDAAPTKAPADVGGGESILVAEDEDGVRYAVSRQLRQAGYSVLEASSGKEALEIFEERDEPIGLLLTDVIMPGMSGKDLADRLKELQPGLKVIYMSGYTHDVINQEGVLEQGAVLLQKPFSGADLVARIRQTLTP